MNAEQALSYYSRIGAWLFTALIRRRFRCFGKGSRVTPPFRFYGLREVSVGANVIINRDCWIHIIGHHKPTTNRPRIVVESRAGIGMGCTISAAERVTIQEGALLARNVYISDHSHAYEDVGVPIAVQGIDTVAPVVIGRNSWLGQNVVVLPGVIIGQHCVIGANSVVRSTIPDFCVAVGAPARVVKRYNPETGSWEPVKPASKAV